MYFPFTLIVCNAFVRWRRPPHEQSRSHRPNQSQDNLFQGASARWKVFWRRATGESPQAGKTAIIEAQIRRGGGQHLFPLLTPISNAPRGPRAGGARGGAAGGRTRATRPSNGTGPSATPRNPFLAIPSEAQPTRSLSSRAKAKPFIVLPSEADPLLCHSERSDSEAEESRPARGGQHPKISPLADAQSK